MRPPHVHPLFGRRARRDDRAQGSILHSADPFRGVAPRADQRGNEAKGDSDVGARGGKPARRNQRRGGSVCKADCQDAGGSRSEGLARDGAAVEEDLLGGNAEHGGEQESLGEGEARWMVKPGARYWRNGVGEARKRDTRMFATNVVTIWKSSRREKEPSINVRNVLGLGNNDTRFCLIISRSYVRKESFQDALFESNGLTIRGKNLLTLY